MDLSIREMQREDIDKIVSYFVDADLDHLKGMGADKDKLPERADWINRLILESQKSYQEKEYYYVIWMIDGQPSGHSNINHIQFGESATMHLHLWQNTKRKSGLGFQFLNKTIPLYFEHFHLKKLICEPFAENMAPNKTMLKLGFDLVRTYETIPGPINFLQTVNRYELTKDKMEALFLN